MRIGQWEERWSGYGWSIGLDTSVCHHPCKNLGAPWVISLVGYLETSYRTADGDQYVRPHSRFRLMEVQG